MEAHWITDGPEDGPLRLVFAHGAGAPMDTPFMNHLAALWAEAGVRVVRFEFPYMARRRQDGKRRGPDRAPVLEQTFAEVVEALGDPASLFLAGKSMGGRIATQVADRLGVAGLVCLGYPFHPAGKPGVLRTAHLAALETPCLILQGTRDALGNAEEVPGYELGARVRVEWLEDGDHSLAPRVKSGHTTAQHLARAAELALAFMRSVRAGADGGGRPSSA